MMAAIVGMPVSFDGERPPLRRGPPALGADSDMILGGATTSAEKKKA